MVPMLLRRRIVPARVLTHLRILAGGQVYEPYNDEHQAIFIHVPKTAGVSIGATLFGTRSRHAPWFEYRNADPIRFRSYFKFGFVRNPWDRAVSAYFHLRAKQFDWVLPILDRYPDFDSFVRGWLTRWTAIRPATFLPQSYFLLNRRGSLMIDVLGRFENLEQDFGLVANRLGCHATLPVMNASEHGQYTDYYTQTSRDIVGRIYARDIQAFDYRFEQRADSVAHE